MASTRKVVPLLEVTSLPMVTKSIVKRVFLEVDGVDDENIELYWELRLAAIKREDPVIHAVLMLIRENAQREFDEETGKIALRAAVTLYLVFKRQTMFDNQERFLRTKLKEDKKKCEKVQQY